jgi:hypothetical protein
MNALDYKNKLKTIKVPTLMRKIVKTNSFQIIQLNQINLDKGEDYEGDIVGTYLPSTEEIAKTSNPRPGGSKDAGTPFNFDWTGALISRIFITYNNNIIKFDSRGKGDSDKQIFVKDNLLLGAQPDDVEEINYEILLPDLQEEVKKILEK